MGNHDSVISTQYFVLPMTFFSGSLISMGIKLNLYNCSINVVVYICITKLIKKKDLNNSNMKAICKNLSTSTCSYKPTSR